MTVNKSQQGFTLIEILTVIFVIAVGLVSIFSLIQVTSSSSQLISHQLTATYLAQEGVELVRSIRDTNWLEDKAAGDDEDIPWDEGLQEDTYQIDYTDIEQDPDLDEYNGGDYLRLNGDGYNYDTGDDTPFKRKIIIKRPESDVIKVKAEVIFDFQGREHTVSSEEKLYNWRK